VRCSGEESGDDARNACVGPVDAVADAVEEVQQHGGNGAPALRDGRLGVVIVESQAVVGSASSVVGRRAQRRQHVTQTLSSRKDRALNHAFCTHIPSLLLLLV